jgi:hypothetical protein
MENLELSNAAKIRLQQEQKSHNGNTGRGDILSKEAMFIILKDLFDFFRPPTGELFFKPKSEKDFQPFKFSSSEEIIGMLEPLFDQHEIFGIDFPMHNIYFFGKRLSQLDKILRKDQNGEAKAKARREAKKEAARKNETKKFVERVVKIF